MRNLNLLLLKENVFIDLFIASKRKFIANV